MNPKLTLFGSVWWLTRRIRGYLLCRQTQFLADANGSCQKKTGRIPTSFKSDIAESIVILGGGTLKEVHFHALRSSLFQCNIYIYICMVVRWSTSWSMNISGNTLFEGSSAIQWRNKDIGFPRTIRWLAMGKEIPLEGRLIPWNSSSGKPWITAMYLLVMSTVCYWSHGPVEIVSFPI